MRYKHTYKRDAKGKRYKSIPNLVDIQPHLNDLYVEVTSTDRLDQLALKYYGDKSLWYVIAQANNIGKGTICIHKGAIIRIPANPRSSGGN